MARKLRTQYDATGNGAVEMAVMRSKQLKEWIEGAEAERKEIAEKLGSTMEEHGADALVLDGVQVARIDEYKQESMTGDLKKAFIQKHPRLWNTFKTVAYVRKVVVG